MSRQKSEVAFSAAIVLLAAYWVLEARNLPPNVRLVPWTIGIPVLILALVQLIASVRALRLPETSAEPETEPVSVPAGGGLDLSSADAVAATATAELAEAEPSVAPEVARSRGIEIYAWILGFFAAIMLLGFRLGPPVMTFLFLRYASKETVRLSLTFALVTYLLLVGLDLAHTVTLSTGMVAQILGTESLDSFIVNPIVRLVRGE